MSNHFSPSNEAIIRAISSGDFDAYQFLFNNFKKFIRVKAGHFVNIYRELGLDFRELEAVGYAGLYNAVREYRFDSGPLAPFMVVVISHAMFNSVKKALTLGETRIRYGVRLDEKMFENNTVIVIADSVPAEAFIDGEFGLYSPHPIDYYDDSIPSTFEPEERVVFRLKLEGYTYPEIGLFLNFSRRKLNRIINAIKVKWDAFDH